MSLQGKTPPQYLRCRCPRTHDRQSVKGRDAQDKRASVACKGVRPRRTDVTDEQSRGEMLQGNPVGSHILESSVNKVVTRPCVARPSTLITHAISRAARHLAREPRVARPRSCDRGPRCLRHHCPRRREGSRGVARRMDDERASVARKMDEGSLTKSLCAQGLQHNLSHKARAHRSAPREAQYRQMPCGRHDPQTRPSPLLPCPISR